MGVLTQRRAQRLLKYSNVLYLDLSGVNMWIYMYKTLPSNMLN